MKIAVAAVFNIGVRPFLSCLHTFELGIIPQHAGNCLLNSVLKILLRQRDGLCRYAAFCRRRVAARQDGVVEQVAQLGLLGRIQIILATQEIDQKVRCGKVELRRVQL